MQSFALMAHSLYVMFGEGTKSSVVSQSCRLFLLCTNSFYFVFSVDTTRVEIREMDPDVPGSDYINANYIRVSVFSIR